ncbi:hypothetical protein U1Q18_039302 [Sarracenia purpurea var. burkii]
MESGTHGSAIDDVLILKNSIEDGGVYEDNKAEASGSTGGLVFHDYDSRDISIVAKVFSELLLCRTEWKLGFVSCHRRRVRRSLWLHFRRVGTKNVVEETAERRGMKRRGGRHGGAVAVEWTSQI